MQLEVRLIKTTEMFCKESAAATVAVWLNRNYEMMFIDLFGFRFDYKKAELENSIGRNLVAGYDEATMFKNLEYYHGIRVISKTIKNAETERNTIIEEIDKRMPVSMWFQTKYSNWNAEYKHTYILIVGYDSINYYCYDIHSNTSNIYAISRLNMDKYLEEYKEATCDVYQVISEENKNVSIDTFIAHIKQTEYYQNPDTMNQILKMADFIENKIDLDLESYGCRSPYSIPVLYNMMQIHRSRKLIAMTLEYIYGITKDTYVLEYSTRFCEIFSVWKIQWSMMQRMVYSRIDKSDVEYQRCMKRVANNIRNLAKKENECILDICNKRSSSNGKLIKFEEYGGSLEQSELIEIDLKKYYNNKAFATNISNNEHADISGENEYFYLDDKNRDIQLTVYGKTINMQIDTEEMDNISCEQQEIDIPPDMYKKILIIGCAEWTNGADRMLLLSQSKRLYNLLLEIPDWYAYEYEYTESNKNLIWCGDAMVYEKKVDKRCLYGFLYDINNIALINKCILPDNNHIHIFKMYLIK